MKNRYSSSQAPALDGKIEFKFKDTNIFERVIDKVLYGRWIEKKIRSNIDR